MNQDAIKKHILVVEDDEELSFLIKEYLETAEFRVTIQDNGIDAAQKIMREAPDLVILDIMLPGKDGISICRHVHPFFKGPILMLTASNESVDQIIGLEVGADDYVQKPVEPRILLARIRALLRRTEQMPLMGDPNLPDADCGQPQLVQVAAQNIGPQNQDDTSDSASFELLSCATVAVDLLNRTVKVSNQTIALTTPEYDMLVFLLQNQGKILSRDDIFRAVKGVEYDGRNRLVDITISQIRAKLGVDGISDRHLKTIRNKGYIFVAKLD